MDLRIGPLKLHRVVPTEVSGFRDCWHFEGFSAPGEVLAMTGRKEVVVFDLDLYGYHLWSKKRSGGWDLGMFAVSGSALGHL